jgi:hypothetical protein
MRACHTVFEGIDAFMYFEVIGISRMIAAQASIDGNRYHSEEVMQRLDHAGTGFDRCEQDHKKEVEIRSL